MTAVHDEWRMAVEDAVFEESQRFTQGWIWLVMLASAAVAWAIAVWQLLLNTPVGNNPAPDSMVLVIWLLIGVLLPAMFLTLRLHTIVREDGIYVRFTPFHWRYKCFRFDEMAEVHGRQYRPILEYGGWGIRYGPSGWAYNVRGNEGVQITLHSGKRILIGTQHLDAFMAAVDRVRG